MAPPSPLHVHLLPARVWTTLRELAAEGPMLVEDLHAALEVEARPEAIDDILATLERRGRVNWDGDRVAVIEQAG